MKRIFMFVGWSFLLITAVNAENAQTEPQVPLTEKVVICDLYGVTWYYLPGTETCVNAFTGETRWETDFGTQVGQTDLARRVKFLEEALKTLLSEK